MGNECQPVCMANWVWVEGRVKDVLRVSNLGGCRVIAGTRVEGWQGSLEVRASESLKTFLKKNLRISDWWQIQRIFSGCAFNWKRHWSAEPERQTLDSKPEIPFQGLLFLQEGICAVGALQLNELLQLLLLFISRGTQQHWSPCYVIFPKKHIWCPGCRQILPTFAVFLPDALY